LAQAAVTLQQRNTSAVPRTQASLVFGSPLGDGIPE